MYFNAAFLNVSCNPKIPRLTSPGAFPKCAFRGFQYFLAPHCSYKDDYEHSRGNKGVGATFIGYNSIFFDVEVLRNSLFQSLYNPYLTNTNSNTRADLYKIMIAFNRIKV